MPRPVTTRIGSTINFSFPGSATSAISDNPKNTAIPLCVRSMNRRSRSLRAFLMRHHVSAAHGIPEAKSSGSTKRNMCSKHRTGRQIFEEAFAFTPITPASPGLKFSFFQ